MNDERRVKTPSFSDLFPITFSQRALITHESQGYLEKSALTFVYFEDLSTFYNLETIGEA